MSESTWEDPIVKEVRAARDQIASECNYDVRTLFQWIKARERASGRRFVTYPPRRIKPDETPCLWTWIHQFVDPSRGHRCKDGGPDHNPQRCIEAAAYTLVCALNNGFRKGYWRLVHADMPTPPCHHCEVPELHETEKA